MAATHSATGVVAEIVVRGSTPDEQQLTSAAMALRSAVAATADAASVRAQIWQVGNDGLDLRVQGVPQSFDIFGVVRAARLSAHAQLVIEALSHFTAVVGGSLVAGGLGQRGAVVSFPTPRTDRDLSADAAAIGPAAAKAGLSGWGVEHRHNETRLVVVGATESDANAFLLALAAQTPYSSRGPSVAVYTTQLLAVL